MAEQQKKPQGSGRYKLLELMEEGICGKLYRAQDTKEHRDVLVKLVARAVSKDPAFQRYLYDRWAERQALFEHPNIINIVEVGKSGRQYFVAVEAPVGERLSEHAKQASLPTEEALDILHQVAEALRAAHRREVIHGHLKPSDIFLTKDASGEPLVKVLFADIGTAISQSVLPMLGEIYGAPKYMAPEVIRGGAPGPQADIFALGVIGYELLTGREPFPSDHPVGYLFANCEGPLTPPHLALPTVPHEVSLVVSRCLEKDPEMRYRSIQRVIDDLDRCDDALKTGNVSVVPRGSDSAFAREYELPPLEGRRREAAPRVSIMSVVALVLALIAVGVSVTLNFPDLLRLRAGGEELPSGISPELPIPAGGRRRVPPPEPVVTPPEGTPSEARLERARARYESLINDWQYRHSLRGAYRLGATKFEEMAADYADTPYAKQARQSAAEIYCEWAEVLANEEKFDEAEANYRHALELSPEDSKLRGIIVVQLPKVMAQRADQLDRARQYEEALKLYRTVKEQFPDSVEAGLLPHKEPELRFKRAYDLWKQEGKLEDAASEMAYIAQNFPDSPVAADCAKYLPELYLDIAAAKVEKGQLEEARKELANIKAAYAQSPVGERAAELDASVLFELFETAHKNNDNEAAARHFAALAAQYPASEWAQVAYREKLGLVPAQGEVMFDPATAQNRLADAQRYYGERRYEAALNMLRAVIRCTRPASDAGRQAIEKLPEWTYFGALHAYARNPEEGRKTIEQVSQDFPFTPWGERAVKALACIQNAPAGMVYVPEGPFLMGATEADVVQFLKPHYPADILGRRDELDLVMSLVGYVSELPQYVASTDAFYIDATEVTNAQYKAFVDATDHKPPSHWVDSTYAEGEADLPVTNVSFEDAEAYARWGGKRLPTETEWEKAARGTDGRFFPWGNVFDRNAAQHMRKSDAGPVAVGTYKTGASPYGALDMLGNVWEWTASWFSAYPGNQKADTRAPYGETFRVLRGGAWYQQDLKPVPTRVTFRLPAKPETRGRDIGLRCVKDVP